MTNDVDEVTADADVFAVAGLSAVIESYLPRNATITDKAMDGAKLTALVYRKSNDDEHAVTIDDVPERAGSDAIPDPFVLHEVGDDVRYRKQNGRLPVMCLQPTAIHRENTIVTAIRFASRLELDTLDTIRLQDAGVLVLPGLQLIHPSNGRPYYRSAPDGDPDNNVESLPTFLMACLTSARYWRRSCAQRRYRRSNDPIPEGRA